jgi:hypothetical protein
MATFPEELAASGWCRSPAFAAAAVAHNSATQNGSQSRGFPRSKPNSGHGDYSRLSCGVENTQLGPTTPGQDQYPANLDLGSARPTFVRAKSVSCFLLNQ